MKTWTLAIAAVALVLVIPKLVSAEAKLVGANEYRESCLNCHGVGGRGDGPMAQFLTVKPADLTQIKKNNDGLFPVIALHQIIDGTTLVPTHGERVMPIWGIQFLEKDGGKYKGLVGEEAVQLRILELIHYIQSIQE